MLLLHTKVLPSDIQEVLESIQKKIDEIPDFKQKVKKAKELWDNKGGKEGKMAFEVVRATLKTMCVATGICNYCERNEASDIEHIYPKSFFPERAFRWDNYLLACKACNTEYKLDNFYVFDVHNERIKLLRGQEPPLRTAFLFILFLIIQQI